MTQKASFTAIVAAAILFALPGLAGPMKIVTGKIAEDLAWTPLEFEIHGNIAPSTAVRLQALPGNEEVPCQIERTEKGVRLTWIAPRLKKGSEGAWSVELLKDEKPPASPRVEVKPAGETAIQVLIDGAEFTRLVHDPLQAKPYLYPIVGPNGKSITRHFPMKKGLEGEDQDHPHHRSLFFTHGSVGGVDFWSEGPKAGRTVQTRVEATESGPVFGRIVTQNEWVTPEGTKVLKDRRAITIYPLSRGEVLLDFTAVLTPAGEDVVFGDTKEGSFGIRLAETMKEERGGTMVNSRGARGEKETWGKPAEWVDYYGKVADDLVGVAILDHPRSFRHPTHWHVRAYGLFAANPFGYHDFYRDKSKDGSYRLEKGKSMEFRYRVYFHHGDTEAAGVAEVYRGFAEPPALRPDPSL